MRQLYLRAVMALPVVLLTAVPALAARDYYVSPAGHDSASGTSPTEAWRTIGRLNLVTFAPGDRILFQGGQMFAGRLFLDAADAGTPTDPIVITSYGSGRATIHGGTGTAIQVYNTAGVRMANLAVVGSGAAVNSGSGISVYTDLGGDVKLRFVRVENVTATGFGKSGVEVGAHNGRSGFEDVTIRSVESWSNGRHGILVYAPAVGAHRRVSVTHSRAHHIFGVDDLKSTGNGIVLGGVDGGLIERSVASHNGAQAYGPSGPVGIWAYLSNNVTIQFNESHHNRTAGWVDGGGFGLDVGVTNSRLQYNYSHDNDGAGLLLAGGAHAVANADNLVRYNISENDGRRNGYAGVHVWGRSRNTHFYNNTVFVSPDQAGRARAVYLTNDGAEGHYPVGVTFRNNIFYATGGLANVEATSRVLENAAVRFEHNNYYSTTGAPRIVWGSSVYGSLLTWANATTQELTTQGLAGTSVNPGLTAPGAGPTLDDATRLHTVTAYTLQAQSPLVDRGQTLSAIGLPATHDFYGTSVPQGGRHDIGAHERADTAGDVVLHAADVDRLAGSWTRASDVSAAGGTKLTTPDQGWSSTNAAQASPMHYFDVTFAAQANTRYRVWLRLRARGDSKWNDSLFVQFDNAVASTGSPRYRIGSTSALTVNMAACSTCALNAWGWHNGAYWLNDTGEVWFPTSGTQTMRIQVREDGVELDQIVLSPSTYVDRAPGRTTNDTTVVPRIGETITPSEIVVYAGDVSSARGWTLAPDGTAAGGSKWTTTDNGWSSTNGALAAPTQYFDVTFTAVANTRYRLWLRLRARNDSKWNDSVFAQFTDAVNQSGSPIYRLGTTQGLTINKATCSSCALPGWGWQSGAYWLPDTGEVWFPTTGPRTLRIQVREDGVEIDQIVLSPSAYLTSAPGPVNNDATVVPKP